MKPEIIFGLLEMFWTTALFLEEAVARESVRFAKCLEVFHMSFFFFCQPGCSGEKCAYNIN